MASAEGEWEWAFCAAPKSPLNAALTLLITALKALKHSAWLPHVEIPEAELGGGGHRG